MDAARFPEFYSPDQFTEGARNYEVRKDFIRWSMNRRWLAPNWIRYAAIIQADFEGENMLMATRVPEGQKMRYIVKGRAIKRFIKVYGPGLRLQQ